MNVGGRVSEVVEEWWGRYVQLSEFVPLAFSGLNSFSGSCIFYVYLSGDHNFNERALFRLDLPAYVAGWAAVFELLPSLALELRLR